MARAGCQQLRALARDVVACFYRACFGGAEVGPEEIGALKRKLEATA